MRIPTLLACAGTNSKGSKVLFQSNIPKVVLHSWTTTELNQIMLTILYFDHLESIYLNKTNIDQMPSFASNEPLEDINLNSAPVYDVNGKPANS
jgi:hypothetical protein